MKISRRRLLDFLPSSEALPEDEEIAALLTGRGIEIESFRPLISRGLLAGEIISAKPHPAAARLRVCEVHAGKTAQIICGAPNAEPGRLAVVAPPGAVVGGVAMKAREIRGVRSEGMLCGAAELEIGAEDGGIIILDAGEAKPGAPLDDYFQLPDTVFDAGITPNRGDCLSHLGIAREIAAAAGTRLPPPEETHAGGLDEIFPVEIASAAAHACPYYCCIIIRGADAGRVSPWWLRARLARLGMRAINAAADITNYVMAAIGQPLHAFDLDKLQGGIRVRMADGESLQLLDGKTVRCASDTLLIADHKKPLALGGVMGGVESAVGAATKNILLEGAYFLPAAVRGKSARHGLVSEAAFHYERGVDPTLPPLALAMVARLVRAVCGGTAGRLHCVGAPPPPAAEITVSGDTIRGIIGVEDIRARRAAELLSAMGIRAAAEGEDIRAAPPPWRFDLEYPEDLAEEIIRAWGYDKLPETAPPGGVAPGPAPPHPFSPDAARRRFAALGFSEIITYAFVPPQWEEILQNGRGAPVSIKNPISKEMAVMRTTLLGGLLDRALFNFNRKHDRMRLFEIGRCFTAAAAAPWEEEQPLAAAGIVFGDAAPAQWGAPARAADFFDLKGWLETFFRPALNPQFTDDLPRPPYFHPRQSANICADIGGKPEILGAAGALHPATASRFGLRRPVLAFELYLQKLQTLRRIPRAAELPRFPPVRRDLSVVAAAPAGAVLECVRRAAGLPPGAVSLFDLYENDNMGEKKCYGVRLTMQGADANLTETDIRRTVSAVVEALAAAGMALRQ
ncbi:MAG: phenylalanine--tRNA ligase subunit beta [Betaproteobacteria bacterium]|nr:phenylalanine--tRNA ligase subunit beta [Betaproteobacteria bacterium]